MESGKSFLEGKKELKALISPLVCKLAGKVSGGKNK